MFGRLKNFRLSTEESNARRGFRKYRNVRIAEDRDGNVAIWIDGDKNPDSADLWEGATSFTTRVDTGDEKARALGELKNLYLAGCVVAGQILSGVTADQLRADLVTVREDKSKIATLQVPDPGQWIRLIQPFTADVTTPAKEPLRRMIVERDGGRFPAIGWFNYSCEQPFSDSPELSEHLAECLQYVESVDW